MHKAIANLLDPFDISTVEMRIGHQVLRGYQIEQFEDAFARYVSGGPLNLLHRYKQLNIMHRQEKRVSYKGA